MAVSGRYIKVRLHLRRFGRRWLVLAAGVGLALTVAASLLALAISDSFSPHGVVSGTVNRCLGCHTRENPRGIVVPATGDKIPFARSTDGRVYVAVTDSTGKYSISLPAGDYIIKGFFPMISPSEVTVTGGQRVEADFQYDWPN
jgi:hypothetical protein